MGQDLNELIKQKPFAIQGTFGIGMGNYFSSGIAPRARSFSYLFNGMPSLSVYGVNFPFSVVVSDQQRSFRQPFNQYGMSPRYKWITLHAGWRNIEFSPFTLSGINFLGGGVELNPGKLRFGLIYGRFNKAIEEEIQPLAFAQTPAYKRMGYSVKLGAGTEANHFDFILVKAKDDSTSLKTRPILSGISPAENVVVGIASRWTLFKRILLDLEASGSLYTRDLYADTIGSKGEFKKVNFLKGLMAINTSTQLLSAGQASIGYRGTGYSLKLQYRRVDPDYKSMGAYYFETDVENYTINGDVSILKNKIRLNGSLGFQHDNILKDKLATSNKNIGSLGISYNLIRFGIDLRYSNYGLTQSRGINPIIDTIRIARTNHNLSIVTRYGFGNASIPQSLVLTGNLQSLVDLNRKTAGQTETNSKTGNLSYQLALTKLAISFNAGFNYAVSDLLTMKSEIYGPTIGIDKQFLKGKALLNTALSYQQQKNNHIDAGNIFSGNVNGSYRISKRDALNLSLSYLKSNSPDNLTPTFDETRTNLNITHRF
ncbi:MAG: hypothetical protein P0Y49_09720 [Candidatus Pedobacter colombiensis]|uniref:Uncharacterized protein n=1 Tax=Candidatus Pedobacter colombiensis TaxID=3121371 RepID=A0AAJ5WDA4_9SPHI|nr:hypothetical protein [Pedobacter sp.]WEK21415.1 MAG: hypothetical protein P0Y49_09720 [Pedobacter sp.]